MIEAVAEGFPTGVYGASGNALHLDRVIESGSYNPGFVVPGLAHNVVEGTQIAANGDTLSFTFDEIVDVNVEPFTGNGTFSITGGTGRFKGATGGGTFATLGEFLADGRLGLSIPRREDRLQEGAIARDRTQHERQPAR